jgi:hypothetical protein
VASIAIGTPCYQRVGEGQQLSATIRVGNADHEVYFKTNDGPIHRGVEPFLALGLLPAMRLGLDLRVATPVSPALLNNLQLLQKRFAEHDPQLRVIKVVAVTATPGPRDSARRTGVFFSCGVDSFFTLLEHQHEIADLVFLSGFDIDLNAGDLRRAALAMAQGVAGAMGKPLIHVETNLRDFGLRYADWGQHLHGPALAAVAHLMSQRIQRMFIAGERLGSTLSASRLDLDPLWSTEQVEIIHDGHDVTRFQKLEKVGSHPLAQRSLRVCWENRYGRINCCTCSKCLRNMAALRAQGTLDQVRTFEYPLDLTALSRLRLSPQPANAIDGLRDILSVVEQRGSDPQLARAVRYCLEERYYSGPFHLVRRAYRRLMRVLRSSKIG